MHVLCCLWLLGFEEKERDLVCLCDSGAKIIPLWNARAGKVVYSPFHVFNQRPVGSLLVMLNHEFDSYYLTFERGPTPRAQIGVVITFSGHPPSISELRIMLIFSWFRILIVYTWKLFNHLSLAGWLITYFSIVWQTLIFTHIYFWFTQTLSSSLYQIYIGQLCCSVCKVFARKYYFSIVHIKYAFLFSCTITQQVLVNSLFYTNRCCWCCEGLLWALKVSALLL